MKKFLLFPMILMGAALSFTSCDDDEEVLNPDEEYSFKNLPKDTGVKLTDSQKNATISTFVDDVVLPTYSKMLDKVTAYTGAVEKFATSGLQKDLNEACAAWRAARIPWERSEAFLFGVADLAQLDPSLDSWPLDKDGIDQIIASGDFSQIDGDEEGPQNLRGFHTAEKMLFYNGDPRDIKTMPFKKNELEYLTWVSRRMLKDTKALYYGWKDGLGNDIVPTSYADAMKAHNGKSAYAEFANANQALELMLNGDNGMAAISNEVGTTKIKSPVDAWNGSNKDKNDPNNPGVLEVESWYSWNSIDDYQNNIISIKNAYFGGWDKDVDNASSNSLHALIKAVNPTLDELMVEQIDKAYNAIGKIGRPFRNNLDDKANIDVAIEECSTLTEGLGVVRAKFSN